MQLMGITPLGALRIKDDILELDAPIAGTETPLQRHFHVDAGQGTVVSLGDGASPQPTALLMNENSQIEHPTLRAGRLVLHGHAQVTSD